MASTAEGLLADLARIWVERWLKYGGGLVVDANCDRVQIAMAEMGWRRRSDGDEPWQRTQRLWHDGWQVGRWRELAELCKEVPGLREAIIEHVAVHGRNCGAAGYFLSPPNNAAEAG